MFSFEKIKPSSHLSHSEVFGQFKQCGIGQEYMEAKKVINKIIYFIFTFLLFYLKIYFIFISQNVFLTIFIIIYVFIIEL